MKKLSPEGRFESGVDELLKDKVWAFTVVLGKNYNFRLGAAVANEPGYYPVPEHWCNGEDYNEMYQHVDELNLEKGLSLEEALEIVCSSMVASRKERTG
jgi:hypothetical protein